jgi:hypothetical protein
VDSRTIWIQCSAQCSVAIAVRWPRDIAIGAPRGGAVVQGRGRIIFGEWLTAVCGSLPVAEAAAAIRPRADDGILPRGPAALTSVQRAARK